MDCSMPGFPNFHCLPLFVQIHVHWVVGLTSHSGNNKGLTQNMYNHWWTPGTDNQGSQFGSKKKPQNCKGTIVIDQEWNVVKTTVLPSLPNSCLGFFIAVWFCFFTFLKHWSMDGLQGCPIKYVDCHSSEHLGGSWEETFGSEGDPASQDEMPASGKLSITCLWGGFHCPFKFPFFFTSSPHRPPLFKPTALIHLLRIPCIE